MSKRKKRNYQPIQEKRSCPNMVFVNSDSFDNLCTTNYVSLDRNPEIMTGVRKIAELIGTMTIYLMENTKNGDVRIKNALSRKIDIDPMPTMTRKHWVEVIVMNMLLYGKGNSVVVPHTYNGIFQSFEPIAANRVSFEQSSTSYRKYKILIDGIPRNPDDILHFVYNPDEYYLWKGKGINVILKDIANNLKQGRETQKGFLESKWKPSLIVRVDSTIDEFSTKEGREKILENYVKASDVGQPWLVPAEQFQVEQVKPLSLNDLAIKDTMEIDKRTVASILGVPPFLLGVGNYNQAEWNNFIQNTIGPLAKGLEQELTRKLIINEKWYLKFNVLSLYDYGIVTNDLLLSMADKAIVTPNEVRDRIGLSPIDGGDELRILENYIPYDKIGDQKKIN